MASNLRRSVPAPLARIVATALVLAMVLACLRVFSSRHSSHVSSPVMQRASRAFYGPMANARGMGFLSRRPEVKLGTKLPWGSSSRRMASRLSETAAHGLKTGIVGLPNVGKSTLFNALMEESQAQAANFPFCTIEPNIGVVGVPDQKLQVLADLSKSDKVIPTSLAFVDIAGLVAGASKGEGLGNKFLANIRECDAIVHVVRCFEDSNIVHVDGSVDPLRDIDTINLELILSDIEQVERTLARAKKGKLNDRQKIFVGALEKVFDALNNDKPARSVSLDEEEAKELKSLGLLSSKPVIYAANVVDTDLSSGNAMVDKVREFASKEGAEVVVVSAQVESELVELDPEERQEFLQDLGVKEDESGLPALIRAAYKLLNLQTYYTTGPKETRAWTIKCGSTAPQAAGEIHTDFEKGFIRAETVSYEDLIKCGGEKEAKEAGLWRSEGKEYVVKDSDVMLFRFNV
ncbi:hypothetical protein AAMO2058_000851500 [Amorphochlora amoebiformis]